MKMLLLSLFIANYSAAATQNKTILKSKANGRPVIVLENDKELTWNSDGVKGSISKRKCSEENRKQFLKRVENSSKNSLATFDSGGIAVEIQGKTKKVLSASPLGKFIRNITQHLLTLKKESDLACKR